MASCLDTIALGGINALNPSVVTPLSFNLLSNQVFSINAQSSTTVQFNFVFNPVGNISTFNITVTLFQVVGGAALSLGSVNFVDLIGNFSKDLDAGDYFVCIKSNQSFSGTLVALFSGFVPAGRFSPEMFHGTEMSVQMENIRIPSACSEPLYYEILEGVLPPGLLMTGLGRIYGVLPNLDCLPDREEFSPGQNWYYTDNAGMAQPWGRTWRFKVRVRLDGFDDVYDDGWFCIRVHNNWSLDRDNFLKQAPFKQVREIDVIEEPAKLPDSYCIVPCVDIVQTPFVPTPINGKCEPCESSEVINDIQLIAIPEELSRIPVSALVVWWNDNKNKEQECEAVRDFMEKLRTSSFFQKLLVQSGLDTRVPINPNIVIAVDQYQKFLQLTSTSLVQGRRTEDLDYMMLKWRDQQNQRLPIMAFGHDGVNMKMTLS